METKQLVNGINIPCIGYGCWQSPDNEETSNAVAMAIKSGYRHIDSASVYGNEKSVGRGIKEGLKVSGLERKDLFVTGKLWNTEHGYDTTLHAFQKTLDDLQLDYLDLYLIHWPNPVMFRDNYIEKNIEIWKAFEKLYAEGKVKAIGVSNFQMHHIEELKTAAHVMPMVNQIEFHPSWLQKDIRTYCEENRIVVEGYCPLANGKIFGVKEMQEIAGKYQKTVAQITLRWELQHQVIPLPKSLNEERMRANLDVFDFELEKRDMDYIDTISGCWCMAEDPDKTDF